MCTIETFSNDEYDVLISKCLENIVSWEITLIFFGYRTCGTVSIGVAGVSIICYHSNNNRVLLYNDIAIFVTVLLYFKDTSYISLSILLLIFFIGGGGNCVLARKIQKNFIVHFFFLLKV